MESPDPKPRLRPRISLLSVLIATTFVAMVAALVALATELQQLRHSPGELEGKINYLRERDGDIVEKAERGYVQVLGLPENSRHTPSSRRWEWVIDVTDDFAAEVCFGHYLITDPSQHRESTFRQALGKGPQRIAVEVYVDPEAHPTGDKINWKLVVLVDEKPVFESSDNQEMLAELKENRSYMSGEGKLLQKAGNYVPLFEFRPASVSQGVKVWVDTESSNSPLPTAPPPR